MHKPIIILGGMGPQASLKFHELLISKSSPYHSGNGDEFPFIVHFSLPVADFISDESRKPEALAILEGLLPAVAQLRPHTVTLACNTAHCLRPDSRLLQLPAFSSMLDIVADTLEADGMTRVGLLASPTTIRAGLYGAVLARRGITTIHPSKTMLPYIESTIRRIIAGTAGPPDSARLGKITGALVADGAQAILLGCTELPLVFNTAASMVPVYDCLDLYADATIRSYYKTEAADLADREE